MSTIYGVVGDSQAEGLLLRGSLPTVLGERLVVRSPHRGWSTSRLVSEGKIRQSLDALLDAADPAMGRGYTHRVLIVAAGGNDTPPSTPAQVASYRELLTNIARDVAARGVRLIWVGPVFALVSPDNEQHPRVAAAQRQALVGAPATWVDAQPLTRDLARSENVHLTADGYAEFARRLVSRLEGGSAGPWVAVGLVGLLWWLFGKRGLLLALPVVPP